MLLQCFVFNDYFIKHNIKLNTKETALLNIGQYIYYLLNEDLNKGFWNLISNSNLNKLDICSTSNGFMDFYPISNVYKYLKNSDNFCININCYIHCQFYNNNYQKNLFYNPLTFLHFVQNKRN